MKKQQKHHNALPLGYELEGYVIESILGSGGFGVTYKALDISLDTQVAIKEYLPVDWSFRKDQITVVAKTSKDQDAFDWGKASFLAEAKNIAKFKHPNIVRVLRFFEAYGTAYMVMEYEEGATLGDFLKQNPVQSEDQLKFMFMAILDGLREVHQQGLLHRDIKPDNIYLRRDSSPMLIDFGSARQSIGEKSRSLSVVISEGYAPKEQYSSRGKQGAWTDIYAVGASLYRCISTNPPVAANDRTEARDEGEADPVIPAVTLGEGRYSDVFLVAIDKSLAFLPKDRPQTVREFQGLLQGAGDEENGSEQAKQQAEARRQTKREADPKPIPESKIEADTPTTENGISGWGFVVVVALLFLVLS